MGIPKELQKIHIMPREVNFDVGMTCEGCAGACQRILGKVDGVSDVKTDVANKSVIVIADEKVSSEFLLGKLQKWSESSGKSVALVSG